MYIILAEPEEEYGIIAGIHPRTCLSVVMVKLLRLCNKVVVSIVDDTLVNDCTALCEVVDQVLANVKFLC